MRVMWVMNLEHEAGVNHGGNLRYINFAREMSNSGHQVIFVTENRPHEDETARTQFLQNLVSEKIICGFSHITYHHPKLLGKLARLTVHPSVANRMLQAARQDTVRQLRKLVQEFHPDLIILSTRRLLFLLHEREQLPPIIADWTDSFTLYAWRQMQVNKRAKNWRGVANNLYSLYNAAIEEGFYSKQANLNIVVSSVDKMWIDRLSRQPHKTAVLFNGVNVQRDVKSTRGEPYRMIFTGNMSFPPNYEAAIWFIDSVMPLVTERFSDARLIVAGANPVDELKQRASRHVEVTGFVEDMNREISRSSIYVAPLVSGGGFKNKILEAMTNSIPIVATSFAVEFLDANIMPFIEVADTPQDFANCIAKIWSDEAAAKSRASRLKQIIDEDFSWKRRADDFINYAQSVVVKPPTVQDTP